MSAKLCKLLFSLKIPMLTIKLATTGQQQQHRAGQAGQANASTTRNPYKVGQVWEWGGGGVADRTVELVTSDEI